MATSPPPQISQSSQADVAFRPRGYETDIVSWIGKLETLKQVKKDVMEMRKGSECGMGFEEFQDLEVGDQVQAYEEIHTTRSL